jgi:hypothetical protein
MIIEKIIDRISDEYIVIVKVTVDDIVKEIYSFDKEDNQSDEQIIVIIDADLILKGYSL